MILLQNGCAYSGFSVVPSNWDKPRAPLKRKWYIHYLFYSHDYPAGKLKIIKSGINRIHDRTQRQEAVRALLAFEKDLLEKQGYNPILNIRIPPRVQAANPQVESPKEADKFLLEAKFYLIQ